MKRCEACFHHCQVKEGDWGRCRGRKNEGGVIQAGNYGKVVSLSLDPIEKKPLVHFHPGSSILSLGSFGCNMHCDFCPNAAISQRGEEVPWMRQTPSDVVDLAKSLEKRGNLGVAFTYNEPLVGYEFVRDVAKTIRREGMKTVLVTNGCFKEAVIREVLPHIDAFNVDLKAFRPESYRRLGGNLPDVLRFLEMVKEKHLEITMLVVPGLQEMEEMEEAFRWIGALSDRVVLHLSRFFPAWKRQHVAPTDRAQMLQLAERAERYLRYVRLGNMG